jgi:hypothetical protein
VIEMAKKEKTLFITNIRQLRKVLSRLMDSQTMQYKQIILGDANRKQLEKAQQELSSAILTLWQIK